MTFEEEIKSFIREVPNFPINGVSFKDISPVFLSPVLITKCVKGLVFPWKDMGITKVIGIDSRGFLLGPQISVALESGFVLVRKKGKLPPETIEVTYQLEYGEASMESVKFAIQPGDRVLIHDDLLATGGTAAAAAQLVQQLDAEVVGFSFLVELDFLEGRQRIEHINPQIHSLVRYTE